MDTWNRMTYIKTEREGGTGWDRVKGLVKECICIIQRHSQQYGDGQKEGCVRDGWRRAKGEVGETCNSVHNKNKVKK